MNTWKSQHPRVFFWLHTGVMLITILVSAWILTLDQAGFADDWTIYGREVTYLNFFVIVLCATGGYIPFLMGFLIMFIQQFVNSIDSYTICLYLIVGTTSYALYRFGMFRKLWRSIVSAFLLIAVDGWVWFVVDHVAQAQGLSNIALQDAAHYMVSTIPECLAGALVVYAFFQYTSIDVQAVFCTGYDGWNREKRDDNKQGHRFGISTKITVIIFLQGMILSVAAAIFANGLLDAMGSSFMGFAPADDVPSTAENVQFVFNDSALAFDIRLVLLILNIAIPITVLADFMAQTLMAKPIRAMVKSMRKFASEDDKGKKQQLRQVGSIRVRSKDEILDLQSSLKQMMQSILEYQEHLRMEQKLQEDLRVAERANQAKSDFLSSMSHEIRTPINAVLGMDEMILRESDDDEILQYATDIQNAGQSLLSLVNDILDFSKIEAGKMEILPVSYELSSTINDLVNMIAARAEAKGLELRVLVDEQIPHLLVGDEIRLKQIVTNLLTNAVKYTNAGSVTLRIGYEQLDRDNIRLYFQVQDTGIGITEENLKKLYTPFERIEEKRNRTIEGTGLGMSIVKQLLDLMDTKLLVKSEYGKGSDFSFAVKQQVVKWEPIGDFTQMYQNCVKGKERHSATFTAEDAKLLIVDDTKMNLTVARALLKQTRMQITTAMSGRETLELVKKQKFDLIFLDHRMPEMDGIETLQAMKQLPGNQNQDTPVIALTANAISGAREVYMVAGFQDYLSKPIDAKKMEELLLEYLPKELVHRDCSENAHNLDTESKVEDDTIEAVPGIDWEAGMEACGSMEVLREAMRAFLESIDEKADAIEQFWEAGDLENYTILVHALKSGALLIGALGLSQDAKYLEQCGMQGNTKEIQEKTGKLLQDYREYKNILSAVVQEDGTSKTEITPQELQDFYLTLRQMVEDFDFDGADDLLRMLEEYTIPEDQRDKYKRIKKGIHDVDREKLLEVL